MTTPSLILPFAKSRRLDPRITHTRSTTRLRWSRMNGGQYASVPINTGRFEFDRTNLKSLGLGLSSGPTEVLLRTAEIDNAYWTKEGQSALNVDNLLAPDGTVSAEQFVENSSGGLHGIKSTDFAIGAGANIAVVGHFKRNSRDRVQLSFRDNTDTDTATFRFDLLNGVSLLESVAGAASIVKTFWELLPNDWWWLAMVARLNGTSTSAHLWAHMCVPSGSQSSYNGDGASNMWMWGLNAHSVGGSLIRAVYVPATSAIASLGDENATMPLGAWWNAVEGTVIVRARTPRGSSGVAYLLTFDDGTLNERISLYRDGSNQIAVEVIDGGVSQCSMLTGAVGDNTDFAVGCAWKANDFVASLNGNSLVKDTSGSLPSPTTLRFGKHSAGSWWQSTIAHVEYYPQRLQNADLRSLLRS